MTLFKILVVFMTILSSSALAAPMRVMGIDSVHTNMDWQVVNDCVMGGRSESSFVNQNEQLRFSGTLNTNGGGFASLRSGSQDWDLSMYSVVRLKVRGDVEPTSSGCLSMVIRHLTKLTLPLRSGNGRC